MNIKRSFIGSYIVVALGVAQFVNGQDTVSSEGKFVVNNTPGFVKTAENLGPASETEVIDVAIWLKPHNHEELDSLVDDLYNPKSPNFRNWLKPAGIVARFAPTAEEAETVRNFFLLRNLSVVATGPFNFYVRARGTVANVQKAFHVEIHNFQLKGQTYRANTADPYIEGPAAALVNNVSGLDSLQYKHPLVAPLTPKQSSPKSNIAAASAADSTFFTTNCFTPVQTETFSGTEFPSGLPASAAYTGNTYNGTHNLAGCGYTPPDIWTAYNLTGLYKEGFDGTGQTIAIIDWCGSPTIQQDANAFSSRFGLPQLTSENFHIYYSSTTPTCAGVDPEINIDVEWAHAIAPGAKIALVVPPSASFMDVDDAELYVLANQLGNVISGSYGSEELYTPAAVLNEENLLNQVAAVEGISANFATGDWGDFTFDFPSTYNEPSVLAPADSPYATGVGGVTLALKSDNTIDWQAGWGNNINWLIEFDTIFAPPDGFFYAGSGGGPSAVFSKPSFQKNLPGAQRLLPDISWLADPYTGGVITITEPFVYPVEWQVWGGTSLSCPMFSGLWAIANQEAGEPLGQAARYLYSLPSGAIKDVVPVGSSTNVTGSTSVLFGATVSYTANQLAAPLEGTTIYYSALWDYPLIENTTALVTFGTDSGLKTGPGWDDVTGLGTPNGKTFADSFDPKHK